MPFWVSNGIFIDYKCSGIRDISSGVFLPVPEDNSKQGRELKERVEKFIEENYQFVERCGRCATKEPS
jgi:hypothetical protein